MVGTGFGFFFRLLAQLSCLFSPFWILKAIMNMARARNITRTAMMRNKIAFIVLLFIFSCSSVSVLGVVVFLQICRRIPRCRFLTFVGRNSLGFFLICGIVGPMGMAISKFITTAPFLHFALNFTISLVFVCIFVFLTTKYIPFIYDFKKLKLYGKES